MSAVSTRQSRNAAAAASRSRCAQCGHHVRWWGNVSRYSAAQKQTPPAHASSPAECRRKQVHCISMATALGGSHGALQMIRHRMECGVICLMVRVQQLIVIKVWTGELHVYSYLLSRTRIVGIIWSQLNHSSKLYISYTDAVVLGDYRVHSVVSNIIE